MHTHNSCAIPVGCKKFVPHFLQWTKSLMPLMFVFVAQNLCHHMCSYPTAIAMDPKFDAIDVSCSLHRICDVIVVATQHQFQCHITSVTSRRLTFDANCLLWSVHIWNWSTTHACTHLASDHCARFQIPRPKKCPVHMVGMYACSKWTIVQDSEFLILKIVKAKNAH